MKQLLLLPLCWLCFVATINAQGTQKLIGSQAETQTFLNAAFANHPALESMLEHVQEKTAGQWSVQTNGTTYQFFHEKALAFELATQIHLNEDGLYPSPAPSFRGEEVDFRHASLDESFKAYQVFKLDDEAIWNFAQQQNGQQLKFNLTLGQQKWGIWLQPNDLLAENLQIKVLTENGIRYQALSNDYYKGKIGKAEKSTTRFSIHEDYLTVAAHVKGEEYFLEKVPATINGGEQDLYILYHTKDVLSDPAWECGVVEAKKRKGQSETHDHHTNRAAPGCFDVTELALAAAFDMVQKFDNVGSTVQHILDITALMEVLYDPFDLDYRIVDIVIPSTQAADPWSSSAFMDILLPDFATWGNAAGNFNTHDIGQLWVARDVFRGSEADPEFGLIGRADGIGVVCTADRYNVCEDFDPSFSCLRSLSAHEIGHLWDGVHGDAVENSTIMSAFIVCAATTFTAANTTNIQNHIDSRACLSESCCRLVVDCSNITDQDLDCRSDLPSVDFDLVITTESCGEAVLSALTVIPGDSGCPGDEVLITRTYFIQDAEGNMFRCYQEFTVESTQGPSISCPANVEVDLDANCMFELPDYTASTTGQAECSNFSLDISQVSPSAGTNYNSESDITVTMLATDGCGRTNSCSFTVFVRDNTPPMITDCTGGTIVFDGEDNFDSSTGISLVVDDNCGIADITYSPEKIYCDQLGESVPVSIEVTDVNGNSSNCMTNVQVDGLPCGWSQSYIGCTGDISYDVPTETFTLTSDNCFYANPYNSDQLTFASYELCGNGEIIAEVSSVMTQGWGGVTMRETLDPGSKKIQLTNNGSYLARREARYTTNGTAYPQQFPAFNRKWVRLVRQGNQFRGYISPNGINWQFVMAANIQMQNCIQIGLVVTNFNTFNPVTATFENVYIDPPYMGGSPLIGFPDHFATEQQQAQVSDFSFELFPNPSNGQVRLQLNQAEQQDVDIAVFDSNGALKWQKTVSQTSFLSEDLHLENFPSGVYWVRIQNAAGESEIKKLIISPVSR